MSIIVGRVENKFWNNGGWEMPNGFPVYAEQKEFKSFSPNMNDFMSGTIYLDGDSWNHCYYEGAYYNLKIVHLVSHRKQRYLYRLERDIGMDILIHRPTVIGDLANSNDDELLEANLNRTFSALDNPARIITVNFGNVDFDGTKDFRFRESKKELLQKVLSRNDFRSFEAAISGNGIKNGKEVNQKLYSGEKSNLKNGANAATFIFSYLKPSTISGGGKHMLREKINEFVRSIETDKGKELKLSKVNSESFKQSKINGNYCITHKVDGISTTQENVKLKEIDLSGLTDIVPVHQHNLDIEMEPYTKIAEGTKSGLFDVVDDKSPRLSFLAKIRRKAYIPINASPEATPRTPEGFGPFGSPEFNGKEAKDPQIVDWSAGGKKGVFHLWFLDNVNFFTTYDGWDPSQEYSAAHDGALGILIGSTFLGFSAALDFGAFDKKVRQFHKNSYFDVPKPGITTYSPFDDLIDPVVPFGFLVFGLQRNYGEWKRFEYIGQEVKDHVFYTSGISEKLIARYSDTSQGGGKLTTNLASIQPTEQLMKFYLDNYNFSGLCFFPSTKYNKGSDPYLNTDGGGTYKYTPGVYYVGQAIKRDIHDQDGNLVKKNTYNDERYPAERARIDRNLNDCLNRTKLELPEGVTIENGDYLFTDQDYEIVEYPHSVLEDRLKQLADYTEVKAHTVGNGALGNRILPFPFLVEDMMEVKGGKLFADKADEKMVVLCTTEKGGMEIRTLETFEKDLFISSSEDEIVESVDGSKQRRTRFTLIKRVQGDFVDDSFKGITDKQRAEIIHAFYRVNGYRTKIIGGVAHGNGFEEADFAPDSTLQQLFDLVGTDGYAFTAKGKISLISKKATLFEPQKGQSGKLLHEENKDLNLSLIEKINQKVRFQFFSVPYYLNWRSTFSDKDRLHFSVETIKPTELQTNFDQYFLRLDTEFDNIYYENVSLAKKQTKGLSPADSVQIEKLNLDMVKSQYSYQIDSDKYKIATDRFEENIRRAEIELSHQRAQSGLNLGFGAGAGTFGTGISMKYREGAKTVTTIGKGATLNPNYSLSFAPGIIPFQEGKGMDMGFESVPMEFKEITKVAGKTPNIMAGIVAGAALKTSKLIMDHAFRFPEMERRIGVEKQIGAADLALESLALDTKFIEKQINAQLAINQKTNIYSNPIINEREIMESFMEKDEGHGKKLKPAHLICFVPSEEQLVALKSFKEEYGVMCDIPDVEYHFYEGMKPDVIRYRNLDDDAIKGLPNEGMRAFLHAHLLAGIKIVKTTKDIYSLLSADDYRDKIFRLNQDLYEKSEQVDAKDKEILVLQGKVDNAYEQAKKECAQEASEQQKRITELENQVNEVNRRLREELDKCNKEKEAGEADKKKIHDLTVEKEELEQKLADERRRAINEKDEINRLKKELADKETNGDEEKKKTAEKFKQQLDVLKKAIENFRVGAGQKCPEPSPEECELMLKVLADPYEFDSKPRDDGGSSFLDLIFELAEDIKGEGRTQIDQRLMKVAEIRPILAKLEELKNIPIVDKALDVMEEPGWKKYLTWLEKGGDKNGEVDKVIEKMNGIKLLETNPTMHAVKAILDELNYLTYKIKMSLKGKKEFPEDVFFLFQHVYPGRSARSSYEMVFGDMDIAVLRKKYAEEVKCVAGATGKTPGSILTQYDNEIRNPNMEDFPMTPGRPPEPAPEAPKVEEKPQADEDIKFGKFSLTKFPDGTPIREYNWTADIISRFEDKYLGDFSTEGIERGNTGASIESYYGRYLVMLPKTQENWFGAANSDGTGSSKVKGGNKYKLAHTPYQLGKKGHSRRYTNLAGFKRKRYMDVFNNVNNLLGRLDEMTVDNDFLQKVLNGEITLKIRVNSYFKHKFNDGEDYGYLPSTSTALIGAETIRQFSSRGLLETFIKFLYIFDRNRLEISHWAFDYNDSWPVAQAYYGIGADLEKHYKNLGAVNNDRKETFGIGFIYASTFSPFYNSDGKFRFENNVPTSLSPGTIDRSDWKVAFSVNGYEADSYDCARYVTTRFLRYFYAVVTGKWPKIHPGQVNKNSSDPKDNPVLAYLEALNKLANY